MSIKSDRWIREECQTERWAWMRNGVFMEWVSREDLRDGEPGPMAKQASQIGPVSVEKISQSPLITPYFPRTTEEQYKAIGDDDGERSIRNVIPYGVSSYGYDIRCGTEFKIFTNINSTHIDPKNFDEKNFVTKFVPHGEPCIIPPNSFALANTLEVFDIRRNMLVICIGKSTYARCGIVVNVTPLEPEWKGSLTLEFSNTTPLPAYIYAGEGCAQVLFLESDEECEISYADRNGKYQNQAATPIPPKM